MAGAMILGTSKELGFQSDLTSFINEAIIQVYLVFCYELSLLSHFMFLLG